jgi:acyl-CoA thioesterase-2
VAVETLREGRLFSHRRVRVARGERVLFSADGTFTEPPAGTGHPFDYQEAVPDAGLPAPEELPDDGEVARREGLEFWPGPLEFRWIGRPQPEPLPGEGGRWSVWVRPRLALEDDPALRAGALAFLADVHCDYAVRRRLGPDFTRDRFISLEQSLWVHADVPWDDWWLLTSDTPTAHAGRALNWRWLFDREGRHLATLAQHSLLRGPAPPR